MTKATRGEKFICFTVPLKSELTSASLGCLVMCRWLDLEASTHFLWGMQQMSFLHLWDKKLSLVYFWRSFVSFNRMQRTCWQRSLYPCSLRSMNTQANTEPHSRTNIRQKTKLTFPRIHSSHLNALTSLLTS